MRVTEILLTDQKVIRIYMYDILKCVTIDLTTHVQVVTNRYETPTDPNANEYAKGLI